MDAETLSVYNSEAVRLSAHYEAADLSPIHDLLLRHLPPGGTVLDIGCGSGRDAAFLCSRGFQVSALDGSPAMLESLASLHPELANHLILKNFPLDSTDPLLTRCFDSVICLAMLMHVPNHDVFECARQFSILLKPGGILALSISCGRTELVNGRDKSGRLYIERPPEQIQLLFERLGFRLIAREDQSDSLNRPLRWTLLIMQNASVTPGLRAVDQIESVISKDKKDATYKFALLRALCAIAQTESQAVRWSNDGFVEVPLGLITEKWLFYYWPIIELDPSASIVSMPQKRGLEINKRLAFRTPLWNFIQAYGPGNMNAAFADFKSAKVPIPLRDQLDFAINSIAATIVDGPVTFSGGLKQPHFHFTGSKTARGKCRDPRSTCDRLGHVRVPVAMWRELCLIGQWIGESLILRWAELTHDISNGRISIADAVARLLIQPEPDRDVQFARSIYSGQSDLTCVWTQELLRKDWHVDHAVPFSVWHNNDLWNLFPCSQRANSEKSDKLVTVALLQKSRDRIIQSWELLHSYAEERFSIEISRSLLHDSGMFNWQTRAFNGFVESLELVAVQRGADRWDGPRETRKKSSVNSTSDFTQPVLLNYDVVEQDAFKTALPFVGALAAGKLTNGFLLGNLAECRNAQWLRVPPSLAGPKRFIVEVAGGSMEPTFRRGELLVFEYHRTPRQDGQVVIVCATETPDDIPEVAIKRIRETVKNWLIISDNPKFKTISVSKEQCQYPILGILVAKIK